MKKNSSNIFSNSLNKAVNNIYLGKKPALWAFFLILFFYALVSVLVVMAARSEVVFSLFGTMVPFAAFTGVFSLAANISLMFLVIFYRRTGFITALIILFSQFPIMFVNFFVSQTSASIPGLFSNIFTIAVCSIIHMNNQIVGKYQEKIHYQAVTDPLTGLPNRFACTELIDDFVNSKTAFAVVSININSFKSINDTMGHEVGNKVLVEIANRWKTLAESRKTSTIDFVARLGGDEFALVSIGYKDNDELLNTINAYKDELERTITIYECDYFLTASFGYAKNPTDANAGASLLSCADAAMHAAKKHELSSCILRFSPGFLETERSIDMERQVRNALLNGKISYDLQPQYDMNHKLRGFEALARMRDSDGAYISPADFIPVAERIGLVDQIDMIVLRQAAEFLAATLKIDGVDIIMSFNVSVRHLMKNYFIDELKDIIEKTDVPADHLELEITESIMIDSAEKALQRIDEVKKMGIKVAIDDFGTGYSSLGYLNKLPSDMLKIDKSFIAAMNQNESSKQYVASIVSIGHILKFKVISEGVESPEQLDALRNIGCDYVQGYFWGKPVSPEEAAKLVHE